MPYGNRYRKREQTQLWVMSTVVLVLACYRLVAELRDQVQSFFAAYTEFPVAILVMNILFFFLLFLLWVIYRRWKEAIRAEDDLERVLMSISPDSLIVINYDRIITMCSGQVEAMFGYKAEGIIGKKTEMLYYDRRTHGKSKEIAERLDQKGFHLGYATGKRRDGATFPLEVITGTIREGRGAVILLRDITERQKIENALRESELRFEQFMRYFPGFAFIKDEKGHRVYLNAAYERDLGWNIETSIGKRDEELYREDLARQFAESDIRVRQSQEVVRYVTRRVQDDGSTHSLLTVKFPIPSGDKAQTYVGGLSLDITEQENAEKERAKIERKMLQAQKLESLGVLAGGIAHDFNNLLMGIVGHADLAMSSLHDADSGVKTRLEAVVESSQQAAELANQLLAYSGHGRFMLEVVDLTALVSTLSGLLKVSVSKKSILHFDLDAELLPVECDVTQIRQVVMNLIVNASDALNGESGRISLQTGAVEREAIPSDDVLDTGEHLSESKYAYFRVSDTGEGMNEATRRRIFDPFFTTKKSGHGLGLAAVLGIVRSHGGGIRIASTVGEGSEFTVYLPITDKPLPEKKPGDAQDIEHWRGSGKVLIADDEQMVRDVGRMMLESLGFEVLIAQDGQQAVDTARAYSSELKLILLDMTMPEMNGVEALNEIRKFLPKLPVILSSGYNQSDQGDLPSENPYLHFLKKPYRLNALKEMLQQVMNTSEG